MERKKVYKILTIILVMQWAFIQIIAQYPSIIEKYYSNGAYFYISKLLRLLFGWIPFSFGDILYSIIGIIIIKGIYIALKNKQLHFKNTFFKTGAIISVLFFFFHLNWGLNYFRQPLFESLNLKKNTYSSNELVDFTKILILKINQVQVSITKNDTLVVENKLNKKQIKKLSPLAYHQLALKYPQFKLDNPSLKHSLFSIPLTYMGFAGYLNPITNEAQVNSLIPKNNYPATTCHEIAHQVGIASESEANFVGYLASIHSKDAYFNYSGYLLALRYCLSEIYRTDPHEFENLLTLLNKGILKDMQQSQDFWQSYQNWSEKYFKTFYDSFLKANKQKDGIQGYSKMVSLLINYYKLETL
ncbi:MAG: DUF3810 domain-containing protein [Lutibacter sp.]|uniref:DUF3810 domain-containing protein n=1 Tax=Lutibacter sp. TaxID=1925666 RepID=UPI00385D5724